MRGSSAEFFGTGVFATNFNVIENKLKSQIKYEETEILLITMWVQICNSFDSSLMIFLHDSKVVSGVFLEYRMILTSLSHILISMGYLRCLFKGI